MKEKQEAEEKKALEEIVDNVPELDNENEMLFRAAAYLEKCGNHPGLTTAEFYQTLVDDDIQIDQEEFSRLATAAIAIETMMSFDLATDSHMEPPTVH